jgi:hypothetical protein
LTSFFRLALMLICFGRSALGASRCKKHSENAIYKLGVIDLHVFRKLEHFGKSGLGDTLTNLIAALFGFIGLDCRNALFGLDGDFINAETGKCQLNLVMQRFF